MWFLCLNVTIDKECQPLTFAFAGRNNSQVTWAQAIAMSQQAVIVRSVQFALWTNVAILHFDAGLGWFYIR